MPQQTITFQQPLVLTRAGMNGEVIKYFDRLRQIVRLVTVDSTAANISVKLPLAGDPSNQGIYVAVVKISADGHTVRAAASGSDLVNGGASVIVGTTQYSAAIFANDGFANWYEVSAITGAATVPNFADDETPSGAINGINVTFTLAHGPSPAVSLQLFANGVLQLPAGIDYTLAGSTITFGVAPPGGTSLKAWYRY